MIQENYIFKAKRLDNSEWIYGHLCYDQSEGKYYITDMDVAHNVDPNTVCQATGSKDCQGNMIYDGDLLQTEKYPEHIVTVTWNNYKACFQYIILKDDTRKKSEMYRTHFFDEMNQFKIIGNIYDIK